MDAIAAARGALRSLRRTPWRSFLVLQGIAWGVGVAIFPAAVLEGSRRAAVRDAEEVGTARVSLSVETASRRLDVHDARALREALAGRRGGLRVAAHRVARDARAVSGGREIAVDVVAAEPGAPAALDLRLAAGAGLPAEAADGGGRVPCVLEPGPAGALAGGVPAGAVGREVDLVLADGTVLAARVVGVLRERSALARRTDDLGLDTGHAMHATMERLLRSVGVAAPDARWKRAGRIAFVPLAAVPREGDAVDGILLRALPQEAPILAEEVRALVVERGAAPLVHANLVWPFLASRRVDDAMRLKDALVLACLAMGGVVIANVLLLAVLERGAEIAIRRAEGATRRDIAVQFLVEAGVLGAAGAALGMPLGMGLAWLRVAMAPYATMSVAFPASTAAVACAWAIVVALVAGVLPARRAASLDPVRALRGA